MNVIRIEVGPMAANAYLVRGDGPEGIVIDPGDEGERLAAACRREGLRPAFIVNTHAHVDHVAANTALKESFPDAILCVGRGDAGRLTDPAGNLSALFGMPVSGPAPDRLLEEGDVLEAGNGPLAGRMRLRVLETPGHTPGGICLLAEDEGPPQLFAGDLVFRGSIGRCDLPGGDWDAMQASLERVLELPDETVIWPGHGPATTLAEERAANPFLADRAR